MSVRAFFATAFVAVFLAGCSGSSSTVIPSPSTSLRINSIEVEAPRATATLRVRITVPHPRPHAIDPRYMSRSTKGIAFAFTGASKFSVAFSLTPGSKGCSTSSGVTKCTFNLKLATGKYKGAVSAYDLAPVNGKIPKNAQVLSTDANVPFTIASGAVNRAGFVFDGVVKSISVGALPAGTIGVSLSTTVSVVAQDADGNIIIGTYANPITLSSSDGATTVTGSLLSSKDVASFTYSGAAITSATINANASGAAAGHATFAPSPVLTSIGRSSGLIGTSVSETLAGHFIAGSMHVNAGSGITVSKVTSTASSITATFFIDPEAGTGARSVTVSTAAASSAPVTFTISNTGVDVVTLDTDSNPGTPAGTGTGTSGDLRYEMLNAAAGDTIVFDTTKMCGAPQCTIAIAGPLPPIAQNQTIDGGQFSGGTPRVTVDGGNTTRAFWAKSGTITIANLRIQNVRAEGGNGGGGDGTSGGGGGAGLGAGLFIDAASVTVVNDYFLNNATIGGNGGAISSSSLGGGGGGGLGGDGGEVTFSEGGGGGGGILGSGAADSSSGGGTGGDGFSATGGGAGAFPSGAGGMGGYGGGGGAGAACAGFCTPGASGNGGFGGGGGGGAQVEGGPGGLPGGSGGFGGGGGGCGSNGGTNGGSGGPGGGGGGGCGSGSTGGSGGALSGLVGGGGGGTGNSGGGGAAAGPAIFITTGSLTTNNSGAQNAAASGGRGGTGMAGSSGSSGTADPTPVFNYGGTVNGVSVTAGHGGPVASALSSSQPQLKGRPASRDRHRRP